MRDEMQELQVSKNTNQTEQIFTNRFKRETSEGLNSENYETIIKTYD